MSNADTSMSAVRIQFRSAAKAVCKPQMDAHVDSHLSDHNNVKSYAQVATLVRPQAVSPKSGGLKPGRKKPYRLMARFTPEERKTVHDKAAAARLSINEYIRASILGPDYRPPLQPELCSRLLDLGRELVRQGNNLNQLTRQFNAGVITPEGARDLLAVIALTLTKTYAAIRETLANGRNPD